MATGTWNHIVAHETKQRGASALATTVRASLQRAWEGLRSVWDRLAGNRPLRVLAVVLVGLTIFGQLSPVIALGTLIAVAAAAAGWNSDAARGAMRRVGRAGGSGSSSRGDIEAWRAVIDAIPDAAVALDAAGMIIHHNALARELFPNIRERQPISYVSRHPDLLDAVDRVGPVNEPISVQLMERVPVERHIAAIVSGLPRARTLPAVLITFRDLTEQDKLAQMRADFIANASHELRTPLASLRGFVETLQGPARNDPEARDRFLALMSSQANRMTRLIDDLLSLSRVEMRAHLPPRGIVELNEVAAYVTQTLEPLAKASDITVSLERLGRPARIRGDREEIVQVLQNLMQNAIKYGRVGGHVQIIVGREELAGGDARLTVSVIDDGPGIAPHHLPRLTERFYRADVASSRDKGGTGLGLAIVKHILNRHRGELRIASELGKGSTFTVVVDELRSARLEANESVR